MYALVARRVVAHRGCRLVVLGAQRSRYLDLCSQAVAVRFEPDQLHNDPVILVVANRGAGAVNPDLRWSVQNRHDGIDFAVVVEVAEGRAAMRGGNLEGRPSLCTLI